jgi:hypothetical protein
MGRRLLALTLLIAFGFPLVAPLFAATVDPEASLPSCCRSHGAHQCSMMHMRSPSSGTAFQTPPCPSYPTASTPLRIAAASLASPLRITVEQLSTTAPLAPNPYRALTFSTSANLKRGPPTRLS